MRLNVKGASVYYYYNERPSTRLRYANYFQFAAMWDQWMADAATVHITKDRESPGEVLYYSGT